MSLDDENECDRCLKNFPLVDGKWIKPKLIKGCESYNIDEKCTLCVQGYTLQNGNCVFN